MNSQLTPDLSSRLITLPDGRPGLRATIQTEIRENSCNSCLDFIASDETLDRYGEIILASGWRLDNYRRNPVFQNAHQYGDVIFTLGKALITEVRDGRLCQRIEFATEINPMARIAYGLYKGKFLNAVSVGFIPLRWEGPSSQSASASSSASASLPRRKYLEQELLEVSAVGIPANPNALALGLKSGAIEKADLQELREVLSKTLERSEKAGAVPSGNRPALRPINYPRLLQLAREILEILKRS